jgi:quercetin dioxygenase-like cupin family protein
MKHRFLALVSTVAMLLLVSACGNASQGTPSPTSTSTTTTPTPTPATAQGNTDLTLATGKLMSLPPGTLYINVIDIPQPANNTITHKHVAGFVYVVNGTHTMTIQGSQPLVLKAGEAGFVGADLVHSHANPESTPNEWYFISIRPTTARTAPPLFPNQKVLYATPDLSTLPSGGYDETLRLVTLQTGGKEPAHKDSGIETLFVLAGSISVHLAGQSPVTLTQGQGIYSRPNTAVQETSAGSGVARYLAFDAGPTGQPFSTKVDEVP